MYCEVRKILRININKTLYMIDINNKKITIYFDSRPSSISRSLATRRTQAMRLAMRVGGHRFRASQPPADARGAERSHNPREPMGGRKDRCVRISLMQHFAAAAWTRIRILILHECGVLGRKRFAYMMDCGD